MFFETQTFTTRFLASAMPLGSHGLAGGPAHAPRPVTIVVPAPSGGAADALARIIAHGMAEDLSQTVHVENRLGAFGNPGASTPQRKAADGCTLYLATRANVLAELSDTHGEYSLHRDFAPIGVLASVPKVLVVARGFPAKSVEQFVACARGMPGKLTCASSGIGTTSHLLCELFKAETQTDLLHVPYHGAASALTSIMAGQADSTFDSLPSSLAQIRRGELRALAILSKKRAQQAPHIPTLEETGMPGLFVESWYGLLATADTPVDQVSRLNKSVNKSLKHQGVKQAYMRLGYTFPPQPNTPDILHDLLIAEAERWHWTIKARGISLQ